jgi:hypothetical protein
VTIATSARDVEARSDDYLRHLDRRHAVRFEMYSFTCLACFSSTSILSMPLWISVCCNVSRMAGLEEYDADLCNLLCLWNDLVCVLGEVLVGLEDVPV